MTRIVGHRGALALELENTIQGFKRAKDLGLDAIELDVLATKDGKIVVCHDNDLSRLTGKKVYINKLTFAELAELHLSNNETIPLLYDVLSITGDIPIILDIKTDKYLDNLFAILGNYPEIEFTIVTGLGHIIKECKRTRPDIPALVQRHYSPFGHLYSIKKHGADGLNLNYWLLNPINYMVARKHGMHIQVYTVNNLLLARLIKKVYPHVWICTNHPDLFIRSIQTEAVISS